MKPSTNTIPIHFAQRPTYQYIGNTLENEEQEKNKEIKQTALQQPSTM